MILLIDNYDSFVHNLARYFRRLGQDTLVIRNDAVDLPGIEQLAPQAIVISPGPCAPRQAGCSIDVARYFAGRTPLLGVCLGHQAIAAAWGAQISRAHEPMHGRTSPIQHSGQALFDQLPQPLTVCRYHSLIVDPEHLPACLEVTAWTPDGTIMAIRHRQHAVFGVQFHPEAILTQGGFQLLSNFLKLAGLEPPTPLPAETELAEPKPVDAGLPNSPVTF